MNEFTKQATHSSDKAGSEAKRPTEPEATLQDILDTMHDSDFFPRTGKDTPSQFWSAYERMAKQHDNDFLERQNSDMDVLLIFAGLFSAVSSAFIVSMASSLTPNPNDTTNVLLRILINKVDNGTFSDQDASLPVWTGPSSTVVWIQALAYMGLSTSLMAAFGAVLCKQWLGYFKTSRFGKGSLDQRCKRRQQKLDGLEHWRLKTIIAMLPIFLQLSLLFFGVALSANIWTQQRTVASVIIGTTSLGIVFYMFTVIASLRSPDCPFRTPVSAILKRGLPHVVTVLKRVRRGVLNMFQSLRQDVPLMGRQAFWETFLNRLKYALISLKHTLSGAFRAGWGLTTRSISRFVAYTSRLTCKPPLPLDDLESAISTASARSETLYLEGLGITVEPMEASSVQWILETTTDTEMIFAAVRMIPEVEWPEQLDITGMLDRVKSRLFLCFDSTRQLLPLTQGHVIACLKAIYHLCLERGQDISLEIMDDSIWSDDNRCLYQIHKFPGLQMVCCVQGDPVKLDITSFTPSDRMWMAHMFTYRLHKGDYDPEFESTVTDFINSCLIDPTSSGRLVADCLISAGLLIGLSVDRGHLARLDKSAAIPHLRDWVVTRLLDILLNEPSVRQNLALVEHHIPIARKLLPSFRYLGRDVEDGNNDDISIKCLKLSFRLLEGKADVSRDDMVTTMLRLSLFYHPHNFTQFLCQYGPGPQWRYWLGPPSWHTSAQFKLLVDYFMRLCQGTDYTAIQYTFLVLGALRHPPRPLDIYIERTIQFMAMDIPSHTRIAAKNAACAIRTEIASLGRDDASFRYRFSQALASAVRSDTQVDNPFKDPSFAVRLRVPIYLRLLCTLAQEPIWYGQLQRSGHIDNCLTIADTLSQDARFIHDVEYDESVVHLTHIFAIVDALGEDHQFHKTIRTYPSWPLILTALRYIFRFHFFAHATEDNLRYITSTGYLEVIPCLVAYAKRHWKKWNNTAETRTLIELVGRVCDKLDEEKRRGEDDSPPLDDNGDVSYGHQGIPELHKQIFDFL